MTKKENDCEICNGKGWIDITEDDPEYEDIKKKWGKKAEAYTTKKRCQCLLQKQYKRWLGKPIYNAKVIEDSPLLGREEESLFITAERHDFLSHVRFVLTHHDIGFFWRMTNDSDLRDIFVGNNEDFPSVSSFVRKPDFLVIQLAVLSYKNVAMSGVILEALRTRQFKGKPTWVVNPHDKPFKDGHLAWSKELDFFIDEHMEKISLTSTTKKVKSSKKSGGGKKRHALQDIDDLL